MGTCDRAAGGRAWVVVTLLWMCLDFTLLYMTYPDVNGLIWHDLARFGMTLREQYRDILVFLGCSPQQQVRWTSVRMLECKAALLLGSFWT